MIGKIFNRLIVLGILLVVFFVACGIYREQDQNSIKTTYKRSNKTVVTPSSLWMESVKPERNLTFASYRINHDKIVFCLVVNCDTQENELVLYPLKNNISPVDIVMNPVENKELKTLVNDYHNGSLNQRTREKIITINLTESISKKQFAPPLPVSNRVFAVAVNFPSHLKHDIAFNFNKKVREKMAKSAPRVFFKYPPVAPPVKELEGKESHHDSFLGAYDTIFYDSAIYIPSDDPELPYKTTNLKLDYEVEVGVVIGKSLTCESLKTMTDEDIYSAIAGYVLVNDTKARNPQVMLKIIKDDTKPPKDNHYKFNDNSLNDVFGTWNEETCHWWSYAATCSNFLSVGPFFVAVNDRSFKDISVVSARSYGKGRGEKIPKKHYEDVFYLRQSSVITESADYADAMVWKVARIIREIVRPGNPLAGIAGEKIELQPGDIICLGTPGGTAITSKPYPVFDLLEDLLFWVKPNKWHDLFFKGHQKEYLYPADRLFLWGESLGFQNLDFEMKD